MLTFSTNLTNYLIKRYNISRLDATAIIEDEWDYIEREYLLNDDTIEALAKKLIDIYMVA